MVSSIDCRVQGWSSGIAESSIRLGMSDVVRPTARFACGGQRCLRIVSLICAVLSPCLLSGCALTVISAVDAAGSVVQAGMSIASNHSSPTVINGDQASLHAVCI